MPFILQIVSGSQAGRQFEIAEGVSVLVGRGANAQLRVADDDALSSSHFVLQVDGGVCTITDHRSTNGTWVNEQRVEQAVVNPGDQIYAGATQFVLQVATQPLSVAETAPTLVPQMPVSPPPAAARPPAPAPVAPPPPPVAFAPPAPPPPPPVAAPPQAPVVSFGSWAIPAPPADWEVIPGHGIRHLASVSFPTNITFSEEAVIPGVSLARYIEHRREQILRNLGSPQIVGPAAYTANGTSDAMEMYVSFVTRNGQRALQRQIYLHRGTKVGVLTMTTAEEEMPAVRPVFDQTLAHMRFTPVW